MTNLVCCRSDNCGSIASSSRFLSSCASVLVGCGQLALHLTNCQMGVFCVFYSVFISVFAVVVVLFDGFKDHLEFQWPLYEFISSFFVIDGSCEFVRNNFFWCEYVEFAFFPMSTSLFQYSSNVPLSSCLMFKIWARL